MSNHIHFVGRCEEPGRMSDFLRDFKKFTSKELTAAIITLPENRRVWLLDKFSFEAGRTGRADNYKIWRDDNHAIDMADIAVTEKLEYMHNNPVRAGIVANGEDYLFSSATDYAAIKGLVELELI